MAVEGVSGGLADVLAVFEDRDPREPLATSEVDEHLTCTRRTTYNRLDRLADRGILETKKVGAKARVWWLPDPVEGEVPAPEGPARIQDAGTRYRRLVDTAPVPIGVFVSGEGIVYANQAAAEFVGADDPATIVGHPPFEFVAEPDREQAHVETRMVLEDGILPGPTEYRCRTVDGEERVGVVTLTPVTHDGEDAVQFVIEDITERRRYERELEEAYEELRSVIESSPAAIMSIDLENRVQLWNPAAERIFGWSEEEVLGEPLPIVPDDRTGEFERINEQLVAGNRLTDVEIRRRRKDGSLIDVGLSAGPLRNADGEIVGVTAAMADITDRKESERRLKREKERFETLVSNLPGMVYRCRNERGWPMNFVSEACTRLTGYDPGEVESDEVLWGQDVIHPEDREMVRETVQDAVEHDEPFKITYRIVGADGTERWVWEQGQRVSAEGPGILQGYITDITELREQQRRLESKREELVTLNDLNQVVQRTTHGIVEADSRADIERSVCEQLAGSEQYHGAWIGDWRGADTDAFRVRASEGCADGADPPDSPAAEALRTGEPAIRREEDDVGCSPPPTFDGVPTSAAAIPITYAGVTYGALTVCSGRPDAFGSRELESVARLGEVIGHAIAAAERKEALMGERATELEFRARETIVPYLSVEGVEVSLDRTIPLEDGTIVYCTVTGPDVRAFVDAVEERSRVESVNRVDNIAGDPRFEVRVRGRTVASVIATTGGRIRSVDVADGEVRIVAEVAPGTDVRRVVEAVQDAYPDLELASRGTVERDPPAESSMAGVDDELTERQRRVLEAAFQAGYFDRPRRSTGEEVADSLGVSASTFHEHLRVGERKLFAAIFEDG